MKRITALLLSLTMVLSLCACGGESNEVDSSKAKIDVKGTFLLEPSDELDFSDEGLDPVQRYLIVIYDIDNSKNDSNLELSLFDHAIKITLNGTNSYTQSDGCGKAMNAFVENSGYYTSRDYGTLWGGSDPVRMIAPFAINKNDIKEDWSAKISFDLASSLSTTVDIAGTDIQTIGLFDEVFSVEDDPDTYQLIHSIKRRVETCYLLLNVRLKYLGGLVLLLSLFLGVFLGLVLCPLEIGGKADNSNLVVEVKQRVLAELGELIDKPTADGGIAGGQGETSAVFQEIKSRHILLGVRQAADERLHIFIGQVLKLITVELFACTLGHIFVRRTVGALDDLHRGEVRTQLTDRLVFGAVGIIHFLGTLGGNDDGTVSKIDLEETLIHFHKLLSILRLLG